MARAKYGAPVRWLRSLVGHDGDDCVEWPFGRAGNGYGSVRYGGRTMHAHRLICLLAHGEPPTPEHTDAAHSCGNRLCCNPNHVRHATARENQKDKFEHGTVLWGERHPHSKLTVGQVMNIRGALASGDTGERLAKLYGVSPSAVSLIRRGVNWTQRL